MKFFKNACYSVLKKFPLTSIFCITYTSITLPYYGFFIYPKKKELQEFEEKINCYKNTWQDLTVKEKINFTDKQIELRKLIESNVHLLDSNDFFLNILYEYQQNLPEEVSFTGEHEQPANTSESAC